MTRPFVIGVAGGSGSGKTTIVRRVVETLGEANVTVLAHDRYYRDRPDLPLDARGETNFDHPDSWDTGLMVSHLRALREGHTAQLPIYDPARHMRQTETMPMRAGAAIIVEGILIFADSALRSLMDVKVYVDTGADIRFIRRLERDMAERGRTLPSVIDQYLSTVRPMHVEFVEPSKRYADLIVPGDGHNQVGVDMLMTLIRGSASLT